MFWVYAALAVSLVSFFVAAYFYNWVKKLPTANPKLDEVGALIREGAFTFLRREYRVLGLFSIIVMAVIFLFFPQPVWAGAGVEITFDLMDPLVFFGMLVGAAIPAVFSAMLIMGVNRNSQLMVKEIHRQFKEIPGLKEGTGKPDYARCIDISTLGAIRELVPAGLTAIAATLLVGFIGGVQAIGGYLTGNIISGLLLALLMSNAGGLWDFFTEQQLTGRLPERCFSHRPCSLPQRNPFSPGWRWNTGSPRPCWPARPHNPHTACRSPGSSSADCPDT